MLFLQSVLADSGDINRFSDIGNGGGVLTSSYGHLANRATNRVEHVIPSANIQAAPNGGTVDVSRQRLETTILRVSVALDRMTNLCVTASLLLGLPVAKALDAYCFRTWYLDTPHPLPLKCPPEEWLIYYDCCQGTDRCCSYYKWPNLVLLILIILGLISACCCCCIFLICESCKRRKAKKEKNVEETREEAENPPPPVPEHQGEPYQHTATYHNFDVIGTEV
ncbi:hypothetical protein L596_016953 [Steinernema carpocapsae]|uniref:Uncharacterized protein n=1 Tax=Steinernema carpocapsae TaxID=34508 RepID=A0A4U5MZW8_STECR|nr:hypothetical protein L596_016953 [Steinernema carpocapsae]